MLSDDPVVVLPSPQTIVYLFASPSAVIVNVTARFSPPAVLSDTKLTERTNVSFCTFSNASLRASTASVTVADEPSPVSNAPSVVLESE